MIAMSIITLIILKFSHEISINNIIYKILEIILMISMLCIGFIGGKFYGLYEAGNGIINYIIQFNSYPQLLQITIDSYIIEKFIIFIIATSVLAISLTILILEFCELLWLTSVCKKIAEFLLIFSLAYLSFSIGEFQELCELSGTTKNISVSSVGVKHTPTSSLTVIPTSPNILISSTPIST